METLQCFFSLSLSLSLNNKSFFFRSYYFYGYCILISILYDLFFKSYFFSIYIFFFRLLEMYSNYTSIHNFNSEFLFECIELESPVWCIDAFFLHHRWKFRFCQYSFFFTFITRINVNYIEKEKLILYYYLKAIK